MTRQIISRFQTDDGQNLSVALLDGMVEISRFRIDDDGKFEPRGRVVVASGDIDRLIDGLQRTRTARGEERATCMPAEIETEPAGVLDASAFADAVHRDIRAAPKRARSVPTAPNSSRPGLLSYISAGVIQPGCELDIVDRHGRRVQGTLAPDGALIFDGRTFRTPVAAWRFYCRNKALNVAEPDPMTIIRYRHQGTQRLRILKDLAEQTRADA